MFQNFDLDIFSDFITDDDINNITDEEIITKQRNKGREASSAFVHFAVTPASSSSSYSASNSSALAFPNGFFQWLHHCKCHCVCLATKSL